MFSLFLLSLLTLTSSYNVDILSPYIVKGDQGGSYFGFSSALHIKTTDNSKYLLIGAPLANWTSGTGQDLNRPGAVYACPLSNIQTDSEATCSKQVDFFEDSNAGNEQSFPYNDPSKGARAQSEEKSGQWLGVNIFSSNKYVVTCAHRYISFWSDMTKRQPVGKCITIGTTLAQQSDVTRKTLWPCKDMESGYEHYGSCQVGSSSTLYNDPAQVKDTYFMYGAPGKDTWEGGAFVNENLDDTGLPKPTESRERPDSDDWNQYNGFSSVICKMSGEELDFITSAPRAQAYLGELYFYKQNKKNTNERDLKENQNMKNKISGEQMGSYFGYSMACGDLNNDGYDDLLVSAPWYSHIDSTKSSVVSVGRVYIYSGDKTDTISNAKKPIILDAPTLSTGAFGLSIANIGDINKDDYVDFAIGAPYENNGKGAIYIYHGSVNGIRKQVSQVIRPSDLAGLGSNLLTFGWSISGGKDMDNNNYPDIVVGAYMSDRVVYLRSTAIVDLNFEIKIPKTPVDTTKKDMTIPGGASVSGTTLQVCFTSTSTKVNKGYTIEYTVNLDYKKWYSPRAFFQENANSPRQYSKSSSKIINVGNNAPQCTDVFNVYLKDFIIDTSYIEVNLTARIGGSADFDNRAVLREEQIEAANNKIVIQSACAAADGICQCDIELKQPTEQYMDGYTSIVLDYVKQIVLKFEVVNLDAITSPGAGDSAYVPTLNLTLPPKVKFNRRVPLTGQSEQDVSHIVCAEKTGRTRVYVVCSLKDPLPVNMPERFGIDLSTIDLTEIGDIIFESEVYIGSPSEEANTSNNKKTLSLSVGKIADLEIRGIPATPTNVYKPQPALLENNKFLSDNKLEVRHTVSVNIYGQADQTKSEIQNIVVKIRWPLFLGSEYLLYLGSVYVKDNIMGDNFVVSSEYIDKDGLFNYNSTRRTKRSTLNRAKRAEGAVTNTDLNVDCSDPEAECIEFNCTVLLLKAGSINMKRLEFEMRSYLWLPTIINQGNFNITSTAEIVSVGGGLVIPPGKLSRTNIKTMVAVEENRQKDVLWIIVGSVIGGLIILAVLIIVLWKVGFFKRKQPPVDGTS